MLHFLNICGFDQNGFELRRLQCDPICRKTDCHQHVAINAQSGRRKMPFNFPQSKPLRTCSIDCYMLMTRRIHLKMDFGTCSDRGNTMFRGVSPAFVTYEVVVDQENG